MGLFSSNVAFQFPDAEQIEVPDYVRDGLIDPGRLLLELYENTDSSVIGQVQAELHRVRRPQGGYDLAGVKHDKRSGPLFLLGWITSGDWIAVEVWAQHTSLRGAQKNDVKTRINAIVKSYGIPVAATWTIMAWASSGQRGPSLEILNDLLASSYYDWQGKITNGMVIDSFKKWKR